jgi:hypothetical protein
MEPRQSFISSQRDKTQFDIDFLYVHRKPLILVVQIMDAPHFKTPAGLPRGFLTPAKVLEFWIKKMINIISEGNALRKLFINLESLTDTV